MSKGLGPRGREALFSSVNIQEIQENDTYKEIPLLSLTPCAFQPRKHFDEENLKELASSIQEKGIVQPLVVRKLPNDMYEIVAGERRYRAAKLIGLEKAPVIIRDYSDAETMTIALVENLQRENLNPIEEAEAFAYLKDTYNFSQEELAKNLGKSRPSIANALRLLNLPQEIRSLLLDGSLSGAHGRTLLAMDYAELVFALAERIQQYKLSVRDTENLVAYANAYGRLPELTPTPAPQATTEVENSTQELVQEAKSVAASKRRSAGKSKFFTSLQKQLRKEVHRGTTISGTLENGKIVLPFAGKDEFEVLLKLLALGNVEDIIHSMPEQVVSTDEQTINHEDTLYSEIANYIENADNTEEATFEDFLNEAKVSDDSEEGVDEPSSELHAEISDVIASNVQSELSSEASFVGIPFEEDNSIVDTKPEIDSQNALDDIDVLDDLDDLDSIDSSFATITDALQENVIATDEPENFEAISELGFDLGDGSDETDNEEVVNIQE